MKKKFLVGLAIVFSMLCLNSQGFAGTIDFENMPQTYWFNGGQQNFGSYWAGMNFGPESTILEDQVYGYNNSGYPPHSGHAVLFSITVPSITADFDNPVDFVSLWYTSYSDFHIDAYDSSNNLVAQVTGGANYGTNSYLQVTTIGSIIDHVIMHDSGNYFTIDDFTAPTISGLPNNVPEPATVLLIGSGLAGVGLLRKRFKN